MDMEPYSRSNPDVLYGYANQLGRLSAAHDFVQSSRLEANPPPPAPALPASEPQASPAPPAE
jgi:hypothetical protein